MRPELWWKLPFKAHRWEEVSPALYRSNPLWRRVGFCRAFRESKLRLGELVLRCQRIVESFARWNRLTRAGMLEGADVKALLCEPTGCTRCWDWMDSTPHLRAGQLVDEYKRALQCRSDYFDAALRYALKRRRGELRADGEAVRHRPRLSRRA